MKYLVFTANVSTSILIYQELLLDYYSLLVRKQQYFLKVDSINIDTYFNWLTEVVLLDQLYSNLGTKLKGCRRMKENLTKYSTCDIHGYLQEKYPRLMGIFSTGNSSMRSLRIFMHSDMLEKKSVKITGPLEGKAQGGGSSGKQSRVDGPDGNIDEPAPKKRTYCCSQCHQSGHNVIYQSLFDSLEGFPDNNFVETTKKPQKGGFPLELSLHIIGMCGNVLPVKTEVLPIRDQGHYTLPSQIEPTVQLKRKGAPNWFDSMSTQLELISLSMSPVYGDVEIFETIFVSSHPVMDASSPGVVNNSAVCKVKQCCFTLEVPAAITGAWLLTSNHPCTLRSELVYFYTGPPHLEEKRSLLVNVVHILSLLFYNGFAPHNFWMSRWTATQSIQSLFEGLVVPKREFTVVPCTTFNLEGMAFQGGEEPGWEGEIRTQEVSERDLAVKFHRQMSGDDRKALGLSEQCQPIGLRQYL
ncbi:hypothetical protein BT96DRAFT_934527 [Gymnopus androsaceus JB14]|uniref:Uncharacterized protein n=1 Tax=Gymnopus androsaceus JB14 TaxID=1447944 RepID=A0A6A4I7U5_9AGAR|nr:hypothetical protein BT96DRAFT_934527 [Gymnopus androsaceus JB14]